MKRTGQRINYKGNDYYLTGTLAGYDVYEHSDGERILVDESGEVTHSTIADIIAWRDEKSWSQSQ